ncbi:MAG: glycosyltransferase family 2 protein [Neisseriales bacterium]|nr:MAG: glycosyltransferase family 2 protein [Neisseriales bacterium]
MCGVPNISVIMPVYNAAPYLKESIESILNQIFDDFEFIIIDDFSTDNSYNVLEYYAAKDSRIRLFKNDRNYKQAYTRNIGIKHSRGKYLAFMDADDIALPERLIKQFEFMETNENIDIAGVWYIAYSHDMSNILYKQQDPIKHWEIVINMHLFRNALAQYVIVRRHVFDVVLYDASYKNLAEDYELWLRAIEYGFILANLSTVLMKYRVYELSSCHKNGSQIDVYIQSVHKKYLKHLFGVEYYDHIAEDHELLVYRNKTISFFLRNLGRYTKHLNLLKQANDKNKIYPQQAFDEVIEQLSVKNKVFNKLKKIFRVHVARLLHIDKQL